VIQNGGNIHVMIQIVSTFFCAIPNLMMPKLDAFVFSHRQSQLLCGARWRFLSGTKAGDQDDALEVQAQVDSMDWRAGGCPVTKGVEKGMRGPTQVWWYPKLDRPSSLHTILKLWHVV
jgi:hypothetical protein